MEIAFSGTVYSDRCFPSPNFFRIPSSCSPKSTSLFFLIRKHADNNSNKGSWGKKRQRKVQGTHTLAHTQTEKKKTKKPTTLENLISKGGDPAGMVGGSLDKTLSGKILQKHHWAWGLTLSVVCSHSETPLEKLLFSLQVFVS